MGIRVLSLFDGMGCGYQALKRAGIAVSEYHAYEVDKYAIQVAKKNHPDIIHHGEINFMTDFTQHKGFDLLIGGSPCQGFSAAGKGLNFTDPRSQLFFEFVRARREVKPRFFMLENVKMKKEWLAVIDEHMGVKSVRINSALVSAQNRVRHYWCNWNVSQPADRGIYLRDIIERDIEPEPNSVGWHDWFEKNKEFQLTKGYSAVLGDDDKAITMTARQYGSWNGNFVPMGAAVRGRYEPDGSTCQRLELNNTEKSNAITTVGKDSVLTDGTTYRKLTPTECERLQGLTEVQKTFTIHPCTDHLKKNASAGTQCHRLQNAVGSAEKDSLLRGVLYAPQSLATNNQPINRHAQKVVVISCAEKEVALRNQGEPPFNVSFAAIQELYPHLKKIEDFVRVIVFMNTILESITNSGKAESHQKDSLSITQESGESVIRLCGRNLMLLAEDARKNILTTSKLLKSIISSPFQVELTERNLLTLCCFVAHAISGFTPQKTLEKSSLRIEAKTGYTFGVSATARYKMLGNGWQVDTVEHVFRGMPL